MLPELHWQGIEGKVGQAESALLALHLDTLSGYKRKSEAVLGWIATGCAKMQDEPRADLTLNFPLLLFDARTWCTG